MARRKGRGGGEARGRGRGRARGGRGGRGRGRGRGGGGSGASNARMATASAATVGGNQSAPAAAPTYAQMVAGFKPAVAAEAAPSEAAPTNAAAEAVPVPMFGQGYTAYPSDGGGYLFSNNEAAPAKKKTEFNVHAKPFVPTGFSLGGSGGDGGLGFGTMATTTTTTDAVAPMAYPTSGIDFAAAMNAVSTAAAAETVAAPSGYGFDWGAAETEAVTVSSAWGGGEAATTGSWEPTWDGVALENVEIVGDSDERESEGGGMFGRGKGRSRRGGRRRGRGRSKGDYRRFAKRDYTGEAEAPSFNNFFIRAEWLELGVIPFEHNSNGTVKIDPETYRALELPDYEVVFE